MYKFKVIEEETLKIINTLKTKPQVQRDAINRLEELRGKIVISFRDVTYSNCNKYMFQDSGEFMHIARDNSQFFRKKKLKKFTSTINKLSEEFWGAYYYYDTRTDSEYLNCSEDYSDEDYGDENDWK